MNAVSLGPDLISRLAPNARATYRAAFADADAALEPAGLLASRMRLAHFFGQVLHETDGLVVRVEAMDYSAPRLAQVWPTRFADPDVAARYAHAPERLAEKTYGGRMGNGPEGSGDGWRFIGRGLLQITGREAYARYGAALGVDLVGDPDLAFSARWALKIAAAEWSASGHGGRSCNALADADDVVGVTRAINGGTIGLASRRDWLARAKRALGIG